MPSDRFPKVLMTLTHCFLYYRKQIWVQARRSLSEQPDVHARLMAVYREVPEWWYAIIFATMFVFGVVVVEVFHPDFPVWAFVLALAICKAPFPSPACVFEGLNIESLSIRVHHPYRHYSGGHTLEFLWLASVLF
ncbi:unnamed protein product [Peniophora sp. CBMAI 1063]|nr:unnamed protein product [Peniophora sp. CBMAI 1063]